MTADTIATSGFFVLRTPLLPFDEWLRWSASLHARETIGADSDRQRDVWHHDVRVLRSRLREIVSRPDVAQALLVASPSLERSIAHWLEDPNGRKGRKTERSLVRYFARMAGRPMPFGLFAGCSTGVVASDAGDQRTRFSLRERSRYKTTTRLDATYLARLTSDLAGAARFAAHLRWSPSASLYAYGGSWHYIEPRGAGTDRSYHLVRLQRDPVLDAVMARAQSGATIAEAIETIRATASDVSIEQAEAYVNELIDAQVLVADLSPLVTGGFALDEVINRLHAWAPDDRAGTVLADVRDRLHDLDGVGVGAPAQSYHDIATTLEQLPTAVDDEPLFHIDLIKPADHAVLTQPVVDLLREAIEFLLAVDATPPREQVPLRHFREAFIERYGSASVPLLEALDEEVGIGFRSDPNGAECEGDSDIQSPDRQARGAEELTDFHAALLEKLLDAERRGANEVVLDHADFASTRRADRELPAAFAVLASIAARSTAAIDEGDFTILLRSGTGPSGATLLGRMCQADPDLERLVRAHLAEEEAIGSEGEHADAVYAEIVHLPSNRTGNLVARPVFRAYEIECFGRSGCDPERRLPLSDLLVAVRGKQVQLFSKRLGKRIIPRSTTAHGFDGSWCPAAYQLLGYLQYNPSVNVPRFEWGPLAKLSHLPRVRIGRVVLACARWHLSREECQAIGEQTDHRRFFAVQRLRDARALPRWILLLDEDRTLPIDLDNALSVDAFAHALRRAPGATLLEMYPSPDDLCVTSEEGRFVHELIVPFVTRSQSAASAQAGVAPRDSRRESTGAPSVQRALPPGSEWLYAKLYGGESMLEQVLVGTLAPFVRAARAYGLISSWFFIRYAHPQHHIRVRFHGEPARLRRDLLPRLADTMQQLQQDGRIWKSQFDTYDREVERYGGPEGVRCAERLFCADSDAVLSILSALADDPVADERLAIAMMGVDRLFADCGLDVPRRLGSVENLRTDVGRELPVQLTAKRRLDERFRAERVALVGALGSRGTSQRSSLVAADLAFAGRSQAIAPIVTELGDLRRQGRLSRDIFDLALSYVHMHVNRLMLSHPRVHELYAYDFLARHYRSTLATTVSSIT